MGEWTRLCSAAEAPAENNLVEVGAGGRVLCLARVGGVLAALDNVCPHRQGPLSEGWVEGYAVVCPWHSWAFDVRTGQADFPLHAQVEVFPLKVEGGEVLVQLQREGEGPEG